MSDLEEVLDACVLKLIEDGATIEECLAAYPQFADELRGLLAAAEFVHQGQAVRPSPIFRSRVRAQVLAHAHSHPPRRSWLQRWRQPVSVGESPGRRLSLRWAFSLLIVSLLVFMGGGTALAHYAEPGDMLYDWRLTSEDLINSVYSNVDLDLSLVQRRADELIAVADKPSLRMIALDGYRRALVWLEKYIGSEDQDKVGQSLLEQRVAFVEKEILKIQALDDLLDALGVQLPPPTANLELTTQQMTVEAGTVTHTLVVTNVESTASLTTTVAYQLSPQETFVGVEGASCESVEEGLLNCVVTNLGPDSAREVSLTTRVDNRCYAGPVEHQTTVVQATGSRPDEVFEIEGNLETTVTTTLQLPFPGFDRVAYVQSGGQTHDLKLLAASGTTELHLKAAAPAWSPDGRTLAFFGEPGINELGGIYSQGNGLWLLNVVNGQAQNVRQLNQLDHIRNIAWSPDGAKLAFEVADPGLAHNEVVIFDLDDNQEINRFSGEHPAWLPDSQHLVAKGCYDSCGLWQFGLLDQRPTEQVTFDQTDSHPSVSPAGDYLAFASQRSGDWEIYVRGLPDGPLTQLTNRPGSDITPVFGLCGQEIYLRTDYTSVWNITAMRLDGSDERIIQADVGPSEEWGLARPAVQPRFSPE